MFSAKTGLSETLLGLGWTLSSLVNKQVAPLPLALPLTSSLKSVQVRMQCLPLYSILLSLGNPTVDFLSLDIEGPELNVRTIFLITRPCI